METKQEHQYLLTMEERKQILCEGFNDFPLNLDDKAMSREFSKVVHEHPFIEEEHDRDDCYTTQESTNQVTVSPLAEIANEQDLDDEFHDAFPQSEELVHHPCLELGPQENDHNRQSVISLFSPFPESLLQRVDFREDLFHEGNVAACYDQIPISPPVLGPPDVDEPVCHDLPIYDDCDEVSPEQLVVLVVLLSPSIVNNQMVTDSPICDEYPSQTNGEME